MATNVYRGGTTAVAQIDSLTPGGTIEADDKFLVTLTDESGNELTVTAVAGGTAVADVCAAVVAAMLASAEPRFKAVTPTDETTYVKVTAAVPGVPFYCAVETTEADDGPADDQTFVRAAVTVSKGPNDYGVPENWLLGHVPEAAEPVEIPPGAPAILYGLDQSAVAIGDFVRHVGHVNEIGYEENGLLHYLRIKPDSLAIRGAGSLVAIDVGAEAIAPYVEHTGTPATNRAYAVYLKGSAITTVQCEAGYVGLGTWPGDTATVSSEIGVAAGNVAVGPDVTVAGVTLNQTGGTVHSRASIPTINLHGDTTVFKQQAGVWTTLNAYYGAIAHCNGEGTYATTKLHSGAQVYNTENLLAKTFTNTEIGAGCRVNDPASRITYTNPPTYPAGREARAGGQYAE